MKRKTLQILDAAQRDMVVRNMHIVHYVAKNIHALLPEHVDIEDLEQEGMVGLIDGVQRYNSKMSKEETFLKFRVRGAIQDYLRTVDWLSRDTRRIVKATVELENEVTNCKMNGKDFDLDELLTKYNLTHQEFIMGTELAVAKFISMDADVNADGSLRDHTPFYLTARSLADNPEESLLKKEEQKQLRIGFKRLPERTQRLFLLYYWEDATMKKLGEKMQVHESRISQLHKEGIEKLAVFLDSAKPERIKPMACYSTT